MITLEGEKILLDLPLHFIKQSGQLVQIQAKPDPRSPQNMLLVLTKIPAQTPTQTPNPTQAQTQTNIIPKTGVTHVAILPDAGQARGQTGAQVFHGLLHTHRVSPAADSPEAQFLQYLTQRSGLTASQTGLMQSAISVALVNQGATQKAKTAKAKTAAVFDQQKLTLLLTGKVIAPPSEGKGATVSGENAALDGKNAALVGKNAALAGKNAALAGYRGEVSLQTSLGMVTLRDAPRLRAGQVFQLLLSPVGANQQTIGGFAGGGALPLMGALAGQLGSAPETSAFLRLLQLVGALPQNLRQEIDAVMPKADLDLGKASLWLANLQKQGRGAAVLSAAQRQSLLEAQPQLAQQIIGELGNLRPQILPPMADGSAWLKLVLPLFGGGQMQDMTLYWQERGGSGKKRQQKAADSQRFIIETAFTKFGPMQLDGRYQSKDKSLDLMVRSHRAFDDAVRNGIRQRFHDVTEAGGIKGNIAFHITQRFPVETPPVTPQNGIKI